MAQRTVALWQGQYIGIESIYTVIHGKQINIPEKLKELREKSRRGELFCPCGCGASLILVAGEKMLVEQHFRIKEGTGNGHCTAVMEGRESIDAKIVLKCWLEEKLDHPEIQSRVPIHAVEDTKRRYEFTFLAPEKRIALSYCRERINRNQEKLDILEANSAGIRVICVDSVDSFAEGQYPEGLMKVQERQGYGLLLETEESDYYRASLQAVWFAQDLDGLWAGYRLARAPLHEVGIGADGKLFFGEIPLEKRLSEVKAWHEAKLEKERLAREEAEKRRAEAERLALIEREKREAAVLERARQLQEERQKKEEERRREEERRAEEERRQREEAKRALLEKLGQQEEMAVDEEGNRWVKCEFCGKVGLDSEFRSYGGKGRVNLGICKACAENPQVQKIIAAPPVLKKEPRVLDPNACPVCGARLRERKGRFGPFLACTNFPSCRYTRSLSAPGRH